MATVTMTGAEYKELLLKMHELETRLEDVTNWLKACVQLDFPEDSFRSWGSGQMPGTSTKLPPWMHDIMFREVARQLMIQEVPVLKKLERTHSCNYVPFETNLSNYNGESVLPYFPGLEGVWESARKDNYREDNPDEEETQDETV